MARPLFLRANADRWHEEQAWDADGACLLLVRARRGTVERRQLVGGIELVWVDTAAGESNYPGYVDGEVGAGDEARPG